MREIHGIDEVRAAVGEQLGTSDYKEVTQDDIDRFAELTGDDQWIHVDVERAKAGPFGSTIAHGLLTLSLGPRLARDIFKIDGMALAVNYGYDKIRFPAPVPVGSKLRLSASLTSVEDAPGGIQVRITHTWELEGGTKPACVAEQLIRYRAMSSS